MRFSVTSSKLTGNPDTSGWAQVHEFKPDDPKKRELRGDLFAVVATSAGVSQKADIETVSKGRELLGRLHEEYFGKEEGTAFNCLRGSLKAIIEEFDEAWGGVEVAAASQVGGVVYIAAGGGGEVHLFRNGMFAKILTSTPKEVVAASGYPRDQDLLILGSRSFFMDIGASVIKAAIETGRSEEAVEFLAPIVHSRKNAGKMAVTFLEFSREGGGLEEIKSDEESEKREDFTGKPLGVGKRILLLVQDLGKRLIGKLPRREIYIKAGIDSDEAVLKNRKTTVTVAVILLVLLVASIFFGIRQKKIKEYRLQYETQLSEAEHALRESFDLLVLNPERARELFVLARTRLNDLISRKIQDPKISKLKEKIEEGEAGVLAEYRQEPELFVDLALLTSGFAGDDLASSGDDVFILDKKGKRIVQVSISSKKTQMVAGPAEVEDPISIAAYEDRVFLLSSSGIYEVKQGKQRVVEKDWAGEVYPYSYAGNIYLLDKQGNFIWRYPGIEDGFGAKQNWLAKGARVDFSQVSSWTIDGSVWLLKSSADIDKLTLGNPQNFVISGLSPGLTSAENIYTNEELKFIYILDSSQKRIIILGKDGSYKAQHFSDKLSEAKDIAVSEKDKKIIFLAGSKLYSIEVKHP